MSAPATILLPMDRPYRVPDNIEQVGGVRFYVASDPGEVGITVGAFMHRAPRHPNLGYTVGVRALGGCSGQSDSDKRDMIDYHVKAYDGFVGLFSSGGTRAESENRIDPMVTDVPAAILAAYGDNVITLSTAPRTGEMRLVGDSRLVLDGENGILPQPGVHMVIVFQPRFSHLIAGWDFDVPGYHTLFNEYVKHGGWRFVASTWNGGGVTKTEMTTLANSGWCVPLIEGSGRAADEFAAAIENERPIEGVTDRGRSNLVVVHRDDPQTLRNALIERGFIAT